MTDTPYRPPLSPAAQAVNRDLAQIMQELSKYCRVSISATDILPITLETNDTSLEAGINALCAAALRVAADQAKGNPPDMKDELSVMYSCGWDDCAKQLLAIAAELDGTNPKESD